MSNLPFKVKAVFEYTSPHDDDLHFPNGQIITVTEEEDDDWYVGEYVDASGMKQEGLFPKNFVEKYEPTAPPRPTKTRPKKEAEQPAEPSSKAYELAAEPEPQPEPEPEPEPEPVHELPATREPLPSAPKPPAALSPTSSRAAENAPPPTTKFPVRGNTMSKSVDGSSKPEPPPVSDKPNDFRARIAAFNKAAPPVAPFKPGGLSSGGSNNFIKKPFVAPPPSKNAYVPVVRDPPPQRIYRREEDPEIAAREKEDQELAEKAGLASTSNDAQEEDQPKPTSLKERIALLQKQQMEQASRHAEAAQKKEKPKRPAKKRTESHGHAEGDEDGDEAPLERSVSGENAVKPSMDSVREEGEGPRKRKSSRGAVTTPGINPRMSFGDGNEADMSGAGDTTEEPEDMSTGKDDSDEKPRSRPPAIPIRSAAPPSREPDVGEEEGASEEEEPKGEEDEEEEEEDEIDPEVRRKEELRARMAKMSGGMGMHGMFGPPGGMPMPGLGAPPKKKKSTTSSDKRSTEHGAEETSPVSRAPPVPMPGLSRVRSPEELNRQLEPEEDRTPISRSRPADELPDVEDVVPQERSAPPVPSQETAPSLPSGRPAPPPVPKETRPLAPMSPSAGSESDDEMSERAQTITTATPTAEAPRPPPRSSEIPGSPKSPNMRRASYFGADQASLVSPATPGLNNKRASRPPPPIPGVPAPQPQIRAPPPLPPTAAPLSRSSTGDQRAPPPPSRPAQEESEEEITEYEGDYDTDIASAAPHKDALKAVEDRSPVMSPSSAPPPLPPAPRAIPPPLPSQPSPNLRQSMDTPKVAPPPPPPSKVPAPWESNDGDEYDPFKYTTPQQGMPVTGGGMPGMERTEEDLYSASPPRTFSSPPEALRDAAPSGSKANNRQSLDTRAKKSFEFTRMSMDSGFMAKDVDLGQSSFWWTQPRGIPPVFQNRKDILLEFDESASKRGSKTIVAKQLYILFQDYSQTIVTAQFDAQNPSDINLEQRHEQPPTRQRQDQLEDAHEQFGRRISEAVHSRKETVVGDGTPQGLIQELLKPFTNALLPVGTRAYGATVYSNMANASPPQQNDEIRPGDIITLRNTKFQGKHGPMHAKYSMEVGKPDHVGVVAEWDGTKKKVRAWEQGRESKKVKLESFKLDDLRSGEVKIWRVMPRSWVGWSGTN